MHALNPRTGQSASETIYPSNPRAGRDATLNRQQIFQPKHNGANGRPGSGGGEGYQKLKSRLISRCLPESIVEELLDQPTIISYSRGAFIFFEGAPTDLVF